MFTFEIVVTIIVLILLIAVESVHLTRSRFSYYELTRRIELGDQSAKEILEREKSFGAVSLLRRMVVSLLLVLMTILLIVDFGLPIGIFISLLVAILFNRVSSTKSARKLTGKLYSRFENRILHFAQNKTYLFGKDASRARNLKINSREELQHLLADFESDYLSPEEKKMIVGSLSFSDKKVKEVMTPRSEIIFVKKSEYLGPLALDELHKSSHSKLPVVSNDLNHVVGILHLDELLSLDEKQSKTAEKVMEPKVFYIHKNQTLQQAFSAFMSTRHYLFIVVNDAKDTVGLLTLNDIADTLFGRRLVDEFDMHDSLNAVAARGNSDKSSGVNS